MDKVQLIIKMSQCGSNNCGEMFPQKVTGCNFCVCQTEGPCYLLHFSEPHPPAPPFSMWTHSESWLCLLINLSFLCVS